ncbi:hypothetical protein PINS_up009395 [Pythium insidiosum]|nr:hypothetical protein PINS_up009395 [Pythium insidiosum]
MYRDNLRYLDDFKLIVMKKRSHQRSSGSRSRGYNNMSSGSSEWEFKLCIWCLNAAVAFSDVVRQVRSVILTSGTLSPMDSFAGELGTEFPIRLEASHVVDMRRQVFIGAVMNGPGGVDLSCVYRNQQEFRFQDSMGELLHQYAQVVPGGLLMFFPSYMLMEKLETRWRQTGVWARIEERKKVFKEPRQAGKDFDALLDSYKRTIATAMTTTGSTLTGAVFLAVYRGKVSEGIDFSNANARCVLAVGIPFPSVKELQVALKRKYQDEKSKVDRVLVSGSAWYSLQAFRALNQALGRCIRHRSDYGAIILVDSRYRFQAHTRSLSKWIRPFVREFEHAQDCVAQLPAFFERNASEFGLGVPTLPEEDALPANAAPARPLYTRPHKKKAVALEYEAEDPHNMASKMDSVRAYLAKRKEAEPSVFSIFMPKGTNPNPNADTKAHANTTNVRRWS